MEPREWVLSPPFREGPEDAACAALSTMRGICCSNTATFRALARQLRPGGLDVVLEIGSSYGMCTQQLDEALGGCGRFVVGVDTSKDLVEAARLKYPSLRFERADALATPHAVAAIVEDLLATRRQTGSGSWGGGDTAVEAAGTAAASATEGHSAACTPAAAALPPALVVFVDIGGNRELEALVALLPWVGSALAVAPRLIVVKSKALFAAGVAAGGRLDWGALRLAATEAVAKRRRPCGFGDGGGGGASTEVGEKEGADRERTGEPPLKRTPHSEYQVQQRAQKATKLPHPLKAPLRLTAAGVPICRFHNYRVTTPAWSGPACKDGDKCECDHDHCHLCGVQGHIALACATQSARPLLWG